MTARIGYAQFSPRFGERQANLERAARLLEETAADLLVLPELALSGYYFADREEALAHAEDPADSAALARLIAICRNRSLHAVIGYAEREGGRVYNSASLLGPGGLLATYRKLHLFNTETLCFDPGQSPPPVVDIGTFRVGLMICFDWIFPETARLLALGGADVIAHPSDLVIPDHCQNAMVTRCVENRVYAVTANRWGTEDRPHGSLTFTGRSRIISPGGKVLREAPEAADDTAIAEIDPAVARDKAVTPLNHLWESRRPEQYGGLMD